MLESGWGETPGLPLLAHTSCQVGGVEEAVQVLGTGRSLREASAYQVPDVLVLIVTP